MEVGNDLGALLAVTCKLRPEMYQLVLLLSQSMYYYTEWFGHTTDTNDYFLITTLNLESNFCIVRYKHKIVITSSVQQPLDMHRWSIKGISLCVT